MNIPEILEDIKAITHMRQEGEEYYLIAPFFHRYDAFHIRLRFYEEDGWLYVSDCGTTVEYLDIRYIYPPDYSERIEKIKKRFYITEGERGEYIMQFPSDRLTSIEMFLGYFLQGLTMIANVDID